MNTFMSTLRCATRGPDRSLWQTRHVPALLHLLLPPVTAAYEVIKTRGDQALDTPLPLVGWKGAANGWMHLRRCALEALTSMKRADADMMLTSFAKEAARWRAE